jgi:hypothetical protein
MSKLVVEGVATKTFRPVVSSAVLPSQALRAGERLRRALWGIHSVVVCVSGGFEPLKALEAFRDGRATLLVATVNSARGLDLQGVTHGTRERERARERQEREDRETERQRGG